MNFLDTGTTKLLMILKKNNDFAGIYNQSIMRYNQMFASRVNITIQGDFSLHAGDMIFFDAPSPQENLTQRTTRLTMTVGVYIL